MKCNLCGEFYANQYRCPKCFPQNKKQEKLKEEPKVTDVLNQGQLPMVYGEEEK